MERAELAERILARTQSMLQSGAVEEVRRFSEKRGDALSRPGRPGICSAIGYQQIWRYVAHEQGMAETSEQITSATRGYARRQSTWLRKVNDAVMIEAQGGTPGEIARQILSLAERAGSAKESN